MVTKSVVHPLRKWRTDAGLTLSEAAERIGTSRQVWWGWETGRRRPNGQFMPRVRDLTCGKVTADDFFGDAPVSLKAA